MTASHDYDPDGVAARFAQIVADSLKIDPARVTPEANLADLGAESLDLLEITMESEAAFAVLMPEKNILHIARRIFGDGVLEQNGRLTEAGKRFFHARMPALAAEYGDDISVAELERLFLRVDVWLRLIRDMMAVAPRVCTSCGSALEVVPPARMKCPQCAAVFDLRPGDEINEQWVRDFHAREQHAT